MHMCSVDTDVYLWVFHQVWLHICLVLSIFTVLSRKLMLCVLASCVNLICIMDVVDIF